MILRNGFGFGIEDEFVGIAAAGFAIEGGAPLAENFLEFFLGERGDLLDGFDSESAQSFFGDFADAGDFSDGEWREKLRFAAGRNPHEAARFALVGCDLGDEAGGGQAAGTRESGFTGDGAKKFVGRGERRSVEAFRPGEIEIGFVDGDHFDDGRKFREDGSDAIAPERVFGVVAVEKNCVGTEASGGAQRHGGLDAVLARFIAGGGDDSALIGAAADDHRLAAKLGALEEFDGNEEGVHVDVENGCRGVGGQFGGSVMFCAETCEVRHSDRVRRLGVRDNRGGRGINFREQKWPIRSYE